MDSAETPPEGSLSRIARWAAHPFTSDMSAVDWVLWLGLVIVAIVMWTRLIAHFED